VPFGRRNSAAAADVPEIDQSGADQGKGRATPKRADARKARRTAGTSSSSRSSGARGPATDARGRAREERQRQRQALLTGDERNLPPRDAGPERRLARDFIDSRFTSGQVFLVFILIVFFVGTLATNKTVQGASSLAGLVGLLIIFWDSYRHGRAAERAVTEKYGEGAAAGIRSYALLRAMLPRRFRRPPPKVARGGAPL
jgi:hypothetical protein